MTIDDYSSLFATFRDRSPLFALFETIRYSLFATIRYSLFGFSRHPLKRAIREKSSGRSSEKIRGKAPGKGSYKMMADFPLQFVLTEKEVDVSKRVITKR